MESRVAVAMSAIPRWENRRGLLSPPWTVPISSMTITPIKTSSCCFVRCLALDLAGLYRCKDEGTSPSPRDLVAGVHDDDPLAKAAQRSDEVARRIVVLLEPLDSHNNRQPKHHIADQLGGTWHTWRPMRGADTPLSVKLRRHLPMLLPASGDGLRQADLGNSLRGDPAQWKDPITQMTSTSRCSSACSLVVTYKSFRHQVQLRQGTSS